MRVRAVLAAAGVAAAGIRCGRNGHGGSAGAARSAELVVPGQPDLERLQGAPGAGLLGPERSSRRSRSGRSRSSWPTSRTRRSSITQPAGSTIFGTPTATAQRHPARRRSRRSTRDFLNKPSALNHFQTMNRYWMEDSFGKYGVQLTPSARTSCRGNSYQYFITAYAGTTQNTAHCPTPTPRRRATGTSAPTRAPRGWRDVGAATDRRRTTTSSTSPPVRTSRDLAGVRRDEVHDAGRRHRRVRPEGLRRPDADATGRSRATCRGPRGPSAANIWPNASRQHVDRGRELRHGRLRPRADPQPGHPGQLQQPVRRRPAARPRPACGT